jgi:hypothetical protein
MANTAAASYAQMARNDTPSRTKIRNDLEGAMKDMADALENLCRAIEELARRQA